MIKGISANNFTNYLNKYKTEVNGERYGKFSLGDGDALRAYDNTEDTVAHTNSEDEETEEEKETKSKIIVKLDGSRILLMMTKTGGVETAMSIEISKPVTFNGTLEQGEEAAQTYGSGTEGFN